MFSVFKQAPYHLHRKAAFRRRVDIAILNALGKRVTGVSRAAWNTKTEALALQALTAITVRMNELGRQRVCRNAGLSDVCDGNTIDRMAKYLQGICYGAALMDGVDQYDHYLRQTLEL